MTVLKYTCVKVDPIARQSGVCEDRRILRRRHLGLAARVASSISVPTDLCSCLSQVP
jgi:hypothetical protein